MDVLYRQVLYVYLKSRAMTIVLTDIRIFMFLSMDIKTKGIFFSICNVCFPSLSFTFQKWSIDRMLSLRTCDVLAIFYLCFVFVFVFCLCSFIFVCLFVSYVCLCASVFISFNCIVGDSTFCIFLYIMASISYIKLYWPTCIKFISYVVANIYL